MFNSLLHFFRIPVCKDSNPYSIQTARPSAYNRRLPSLLLGAFALGFCLTIAGCGGLTVNGKSATGSPGGSAAALSALSCINGTVSGAGTDSCTVTLTAAAPTTGVAVTLSSNNTAVTVPALVTVPANASTVAFTATVATVNAAETAMLTSAANGVNETFAIKLSPQVAGGTGTPTLAVNASSVTFGNVAVGVPSTQSITLSSTGSAAVTVTGASMSGTGFTASGVTFPLTLNTEKTATLNLQFEPTATGAASGKLTISSNSSTSSSVAVPLTGTGVPLAIALNWSAPGSSVSGYNIYRAKGSSSTFQKLNTSVNSPDSYMDSAVKPAPRTSITSPVSTQRAWKALRRTQQQLLFPNLNHKGRAQSSTEPAFCVFNSLITCGFHRSAGFWPLGLLRSFYQSLETISRILVAAFPISPRHPSKHCAPETARSKQPPYRGVGQSVRCVL